MLPAIGLRVVLEDTRPLRPDTTAFATRRSIDGASVSGEALTRLASHGASIRDGPGDSGLFNDTLFMVNPYHGQMWLADGPIQPVRLDTMEAIDPAALGGPDQTGQWPVKRIRRPPRPRRRSTTLVELEPWAGATPGRGRRTPPQHRA